jgi:hypothetical protein
MIRHAMAFFLIGLAAVACGGSEASSSPDAGDGGGSPEGAAPAPDGGGVCCPIASDPCSACAGPWGGWAASASQCNNEGPCDGWIGKGVDAHGCAVITTGQGAPGAVCCGCVPPNDGGPDAQGDAGGSCPGAPPAIGSSCTTGLSCSYCDGGALCDCNAGQWECGGATSCLPGGGGG